MTSVSLAAVATLSGSCVGTPTNSTVTAPIGVKRSAVATQAGAGATLCDQIIDQASDTITLAAGTTTVDLQSFTNALGQTAQSLARVRTLFFEHDAASAATSVTVFNAAGQSFQGPLSAGASEVLLPGDNFLRTSKSSSGWAVDGTHHNLAIVVAGGTATLRYLVGGSST